jgi:hypothetical protein
LIISVNHFRQLLDSPIDGSLLPADRLFVAPSGLPGQRPGTAAGAVPTAFGVAAQTPIVGEIT